MVHWDLPRESIPAAFGGGGIVRRTLGCGRVAYLRMERGPRS